MQLKRLKKEQYEQTRVLWEQVFTEDTPRYLDYYYQEKTKDNEIYGMYNDGEELCAMVQLNPYTLQVKHVDGMTRTILAHYIIAVATKPKYRKQGMMAALLKYTAASMRERKEAFTYLMPAKEAIYLPFSFRYAYRQKTANITGQGWQDQTWLLQAGEEMKSFRLQKANVANAKEMAVFAEAVISCRAEVWAMRSEAYYARLCLELEAEEGEIFLLKENGQIKGMYLCYKTKEDTGDITLEIREPLSQKGYEKEVLQAILNEANKIEEELPKSNKVYLTIQACDSLEEELRKNKDIQFQERPLIMVRILDVETMFSLVRAKEMLDVELQIEDPMLEANNGFYRLRAEQGACIQVEKLIHPLQEVKEQEKEKVGQGAFWAASLDAMTDTQPVSIAVLGMLLFGAETMDSLIENGQISVSEEQRKELEKIEPLSRLFLNEIV